MTDKEVSRDELSEIEQGLKEISEGKVVPLSQLEVSQLLTPEERKQVPKGFHFLLEYKEELDWLLNLQIDKVLKQDRLPKCGFCGGEMSRNPHPDAGKPNNFLEVGTQFVCIPCTVKGGHKWAERAMKAEGQLELRLDRPELREKMRADIHQIVSQGCRLCDYWDAENYHCILNVPIHPAYPCNITDQILALQGEQSRTLIPDEKEIKREAMRQRQSWLANVCGWRNPEQIQELIEVAKREERERIINEVEDRCKGCAEMSVWALLNSSYWQAIKEE